MAMGFGFGFIEILFVVMGLGGFAVQPNPKAPAPTSVLRYAPPSPDYTFYADVDAVAPGVLKLVGELAADPLVAEIPGLAEQVRGVPTALEEGRGMLRKEFGFDPFTDLRWAAAWLSIGDKGDPDFLIALSGPGASVVEAVARASGKDLERVDGRPFVRPERKVGMGIAADGTLLVGSLAWVEPRLKAGWRAASPGPAAALLAAKPAGAFLSTPSPTAIARLHRKLRHDDELWMRDFFTAHNELGIAVRHDGLSWHWVARDDRGYDTALLASEGAVELLRAGHHGARGFMRLALAGLASYADQHPTLRAIADKRDTLVKLVDEHTGSGDFKVKVKADRATRTVDVTAQGKTLADVLPLGAMMPLMGAGAVMFGVRSGAVGVEEPVPAEAVPMP